MYKVMIVDDEPWILSWLHQIFPWEEKGFEVIASLQDAEEARDLLFEAKPDAVFTDIRMPVLSGLELMHMARQRGLDTEFVIISGFDDFSYAQQAIRDGAFDYRLKPIQMEETAELLDRLINRLETKHAQRQADILREASRLEDIDLGSLVDVKGMALKSRCCQAVLVRTGRKEGGPAKLFIPEGCPVKQLRAGPQKQLYLIGCDRDISCLIGPEPDSAGRDGLFIGVSSLEGSGSISGRLVREADMASYGNFVHEQPGIFKYEKTNPVLLKSVLENIFSALDTSNLQALEAAMQKVPGTFAENSMGMEDVVYFYNQIVAYVTSTYKQKSAVSPLEFMDYIRITDRFQNLRSLCEHLNKMLGLLRVAQEGAADSGASHAYFGLLLEYINCHYSKKLYLKELAAKFCLNVTYCCDLFQKVTGGTFSEYITGLRMKKARELLCDRLLSIDQICQETGYGDYYYFNSLFKRYHGITPFQYRKSHPPASPAAGKEWRSLAGAE